MTSPTTSISLIGLHADLGLDYAPIFKLFESDKNYILAVIVAPWKISTHIPNYSNLAYTDHKTSGQTRQFHWGSHTTQVL